MIRIWIACIAATLITGIAAAQTTRPSTQPAGKWADYRTVDTAIKAEIRAVPPRDEGVVPYLGVEVTRTSAGKLRVDAVDPTSPAGKADIRLGDLLLRVAGKGVDKPDALADAVQSRVPGEKLLLALERQFRVIEAAVLLEAASRPLKLNAVRAVMGVQLADTPNKDGVLVDKVTANMPAAEAGMHPGDVIVDVDGRSVAARQDMTDLLATRAPDQTVALRVRREGKLENFKIKLVADNANQPRTRQGGREASYWKQPVYRLAVIGIEYADAKHNPKISQADWDASLFSKHTYTTTSATGQKVYGSVNDYYLEQSCGAFHLEGKVFNWVEAGKKRLEYGQGTGGDSILLTEVLDKFLAREGKDALKDYDGLAFIYGGGRIQTNRGNLYWPHKGNFTHQGRRWSFYIMPEGGDRMSNISTFCHEFGHMLGLPDLYARPENPGSEGLGMWCLMSVQHPDGEPEHMSAWCKQQLGWLTPTVIDPRVKQKLMLSPVENSTRECFKVLIREDGSEYFLLENRRKIGFDRALPAEGLLIWHVARGHLALEESHGVDGPAGPTSFVTSIPFPSASNHSFTPYTIPNSRSDLGGGLPVYITNIERLPDGRVAFMVGYDFL